MRGKRTSDDLAKSIYHFKDANPDCANSVIARIFAIPESTLRGILKRRIGRSDRQEKRQCASNAPPHTARITKQWLANNGIPVLDCPPHSPHLNPIEHGTRERFGTVSRHLQQLRGSSFAVECAEETLSN